MVSSVEKWTNNTIKINWYNNLLEGTDKIFRSENNPSTKIKIKKMNVIISLSIKMIDKNRIKKIPPDKGVFFVPKIFWWFSPEKLKKYPFFTMKKLTL